MCTRAYSLDTQPKSVWTATVCVDDRCHLPRKLSRMFLLVAHVSIPSSCEFLHDAIHCTRDPMCMRACSLDTQPKSARTTTVCVKERCHLPRKLSRMFMFVAHVSTPSLHDAIHYTRGPLSARACSIRTSQYDKISARKCVRCAQN